MAECRVRRSQTQLIGGIHPDMHKAESTQLPAAPIATPK